MYLSSESNSHPPYRPGLDRWSMYKSIWLRHWSEFRKLYPERFAKLYGPLDEEKAEEVHKLIRCGKYQNGFRMHTCPDCGTILVVPFTCKSRLCLSCYRKKIFGWSIHLSYIMNPLLKHCHATFTLPGNVRQRLFERGFDSQLMIKEAARVYWKELLASSGRDREWQVGVVATVHMCGNGLNYNPHVHLIGTRELVNINTGELCNVAFIRYGQIRFAWMDAACRLFRKTGMLSGDEIAQIKERYKNAFHVHFKTITGTDSEVLFRTAEYLAAGYFHNSQILAVDHFRKTVTFRYKSWLDTRTSEKRYTTTTMNIYEFMAKMLYFLPKKHTKMIRYYGIYAHSAGEKLAKIQNAAWKAAIEHSFETIPNKAPTAARGCFPPWCLLISRRRHGTGSGGNARSTRGIFDR
ncbi:MAG: IS91 family transposase [Spirochaetes bacterium]|nr:MAG: IS91 family transposase [Spirochaetota bacterium]